MSSVDIFANTSARPEERWAKLGAAGDKEQGTYIGAFEAIDSFNNEQIVYRLLNKEEGVVIKVGVKTSKTPLITRMANVRLGQIIGFVNEGQVTIKSNGAKFWKIDVREDPKIVDTEWLEGQAALDSLPKATVIVSREDVATEKTGGFQIGSKAGAPKEDKGVEEQWNKMDAVEEDPQPFLSDEEYLGAIATLSRVKLGVTDPKKVKETVSEATGLAFTKANYESIHEILKGL